MQPITETTTSKRSSATGSALGVALDPLDLDARLAAQPPALREQLGRQVDADHPPAGLRGPDRGVAGAAGDIEHVLARRDADAAHNPSPSGHSCRRAIAG